MFASRRTKIDRDLNARSNNEPLSLTNSAIAVRRHVHCNTNNSGGVRMARRRLFRNKENDEKVASRLFMIELRHGVHFGGDKDSFQTEMIFFNFLFCSRCENGDYTRTYVSEGKR